LPNVETAATNLASAPEHGRRCASIKARNEFVIGDYTPSPKNFDALVFGYYERDQLMYVARTRNGFTPTLRQQVFRRFHGLDTPKCLFANLPEKRAGRWGQRADGGEDEGEPLVKAGAGRAV
jgi:hypothetical protein